MKKGKKILIHIGLFSFLSIMLSFAIERMIFLFTNKKKDQEPEDSIYLWKNQKISYQIHGTGSPVLLLHHTCIGASHKEWEKNIESLSNRYRLYVPDLPGYGNSQKIRTTYTAYDYTSFIHDFITNIIGQPVTIIASSTSACFALKAYELNPSDIKKLALISPTGMEEQPFATPEENHRLALLKMPIIGTGLYLKAASKKAITEQLQKELFFSKELVTKEIIHHYYMDAHKGYENARFSYASASSRFINVSIQKTLTNIHIPLFVAWGEENVTNPPEFLEKIYQIHPNGEYILFEKTRLLPHYENSTQFNNMIQNFIN